MPLPFFAAALVLILLGGCRPEASLPLLPSFPAEPRAGASSDFWQTWGDGNAELSAYRATVGRYGEPREAELVLIYVTEPMSRRTWIKDDDAEGDDRVNVLKLNYSLKFLTGIYPYSVMTSTFSPVDQWREERFTPVKITMTAQEWCGHVFHALWPGEESFRSTLFSYFATEGEASETVETAPGTLYEDALLIQLRELDGPFAGGGDWEGMLVPSLWGRRTAHNELRPVQATITRESAIRDSLAVTRFTLRYGDFSRSYDVEQAASRRVLAWQISTGERVEILRTARLPYWQLNAPEGERFRDDIGLSDSAGAEPGTEGG